MDLTHFNKIKQDQLQMAEVLRKFLLYDVSSPVPRTGFPPKGKHTGSSTTIPSGEFFLHAGIHKARDGRWLIKLGVSSEGNSAVSMTSTTSINQQHSQWLDKDIAFLQISDHLSTRSQSIQNPDSPLVLLRLKPSKFKAGDPRFANAGKPESNKSNKEGLIIWIEPAP